MRTVLLFRRVNVDGSRLKMAQLLETVADAGYPEAVSVAASGNVIAWSDRFVDTDAIVDAIQQNHGFRTEVFARSEHEFRLLPLINPFADTEGKVEIVFLSSVPSRQTVKEIASIATGPDRLQVVGKEIFWWRPLPLEAPIPKETALRKVLGADSTRRTLGTVENVIRQLDSTNP